MGAEKLDFQTKQIKGTFCKQTKKNSEFQMNVAHQKSKEKKRKFCVNSGFCAFVLTFIFFSVCTLSCTFFHRHRHCVAACALLSFFGFVVHSCGPWITTDHLFISHCLPIKPIPSPHQTVVLPPFIVQQSLTNFFPLVSLFP